MIYLVISGAYDSFSIEMVTTDKQKAMDWASGCTKEHHFAYTTKVVGVEDGIGFLCFPTGYTAPSTFEKVDGLELLYPLDMEAKSEPV